MVVLRQWGLTPRMTEDAVLLVSELVGNAVRHTGALVFHLRMRRLRGRIRVEVRDPSRGLPCLLPVQELDVSGRGLFLVDKLPTAGASTSFRAARRPGSRCGSRTARGCRQTPVVVRRTALRGRRSRRAPGAGPAPAPDRRSTLGTPPAPHRAPRSPPPPGGRRGRADISRTVNRINHPISPATAL
ncbi:hypothetical protein SGLAM104S_08159 [Streptomyces glaucescens]